MSALSPRQFFLLDEACKPIRHVFPEHGPYLVGTAAERKSWHDVDVRLILTDDSYDRLAEAVTPVGMAFLGLAIGEYLASRTGLPIDFQIQRMTEANEHHGAGKGTCRNPLGTRSLLNYEGDGGVSR